MRKRWSRCRNTNRNRSRVRRKSRVVKVLREDVTRMSAGYQHVMKRSMRDVNCVVCKETIGIGETWSAQDRSCVILTMTTMRVCIQQEQSINICYFQNLNAKCIDTNLVQMHLISIPNFSTYIAITITINSSTQPNSIKNSTSP